MNEQEITSAVQAVLDQMKEAGIRMSVATSTDKYCILAAFERLDLPMP